MQHRKTATITSPVDSWHGRSVRDRMYRHLSNHGCPTRRCGWCEEVWSFPPECTYLLSEAKGDILSACLRLREVGRRGDHRIYRLARKKNSQTRQLLCGGGCVLEKCKTFGTIAVRERRQWVGLFRKIGPKVAHDLRTERPKVPHISNLNRRVGWPARGRGRCPPVDPSW